MKPSKVDITQMRKLLHTPKDGLIIPESLDFYKELLDENQYLRKFINGFDQRLAKEIALVIKKKFSVALVGHMARSNTIRQAHGAVSSPTRAFAKQPTLRAQRTLRAQPTLRKQAPPDSDSEFGSDSVSDFEEGSPTNPQRRSPNKHHKIVDHKDDEFTKKNLRQLHEGKAEKKERRDRAINYNK